MDNPFSSRPKRSFPPYAPRKPAAAKTLDPPKFGGLTHEVVYLDEANKIDMGAWGDLYAQKPFGEPRDALADALKFTHERSRPAQTNGVASGPTVTYEELNKFVESLENRPRKLMNAFQEVVQFVSDRGMTPTARSLYEGTISGAERTSKKPLLLRSPAMSTFVFATISGFIDQLTSKGVDLAPYCAGNLQSSSLRSKLEQVAVTIRGSGEQQWIDRQCTELAAMVSSKFTDDLMSHFKRSGFVKPLEGDILAPPPRDIDAFLTHELGGTW